MQSFIIPADETPEQAALRKRQMVTHALMNPPTNIGEGLSAMGDAFLFRQQKQNALFPAAPGGAKPSFMTAMQNMFSGGKSGGLW